MLTILLVSSILFNSVTNLPTALESQLKAVYLYRFTIFVEWQDNAFVGDESPLTICVIGDNPFGDTLDIATQNESHQQNRPINAAYLAPNEAINSCHVAFLSESLDAVQEQQLSREISQYPILSVSDRKGFVKRGGMIEFYKRSNRVRFFINPQAARDVGLRINANLLRVGDVVED